MLKSIRIAIVEDHQLVLDGIKKIVEDDFEIVGTALDGREAVQLAIAQKPDVFLIDISLPGLNGLDAARQIKSESPDTKVIFVTVHAHLAYAKEAFEVGATGYVVKQAASSELLTAIRRAADGGFFVSPILSDKFGLSASAPGFEISKLFATLTTRQREVLQLVAEGKSRKEIAAILHISIKTVEFHKKQLMSALNLKTPAGLIRYALEQGLVPVS